VITAIGEGGVSILRIYYQPKDEIRQGTARSVMTVAVATADHENQRMAVAASRETKSLTNIPWNTVMHFALVKSHLRMILFYELDSTETTTLQRQYVMGRLSHEEVTYLVSVLDHNSTMSGYR
jgi:hypothetical protein